MNVLSVPTRVMRGSSSSAGPAWEKVPVAREKVPSRPPVRRVRYSDRRGPPHPGRTSWDIGKTGPCSGDWSGGAGRRDAAPMNDVTRILSAIEQGDPRAAEQLLPLV